MRINFGKGLDNTHLSIENLAGVAAAYLLEINL